MPRVLTTNAMITCPHGGTGRSTPASLPILFVAGGAVLVDGDTGMVTGCGNQAQCGAYALTSLKLNATFAGGRHVMLVTDFVQSSTGFPLTVKETHAVYDHTIPSPVSGGVAPVIPPQLGEGDVPAVAAVPPTLPFSISAFGTSAMPAALPFVFTLTSLFPRRWTLWLVSPGTAMDITAGIPGAITVVPAGGAWPSPVLPVSVTVTGVYCNTLAVGTHQLVVTAVNHRGLSAMAMATIVVSA